MRNFRIHSLLMLFTLSACSVLAQRDAASTNIYEFREGDPTGIGKWYMGREIAHVMGYQGMPWLEREERQQEENTSLLLKNLDIQPTDRIADIGAGSGYHAFMMAEMASGGLVYAVDIQKEMLDVMRGKKARKGVDNLEIIQGSLKSVNLPEQSVDKVLMVDVYHEFSYPSEMLTSIKKALKPGGEIYLIEYRSEDAKVPIKRLHKMSEKQAEKELEAAGFQLRENMGNLPWQHCMVFEHSSK